jgi:hypothetical protein
MRAPNINNLQQAGITAGDHSKKPFDRRAYMRRYQLSWVQHRKAIAVDFLGGRCVKCGAIEQLEFDHIDPKTKLSHRFWSWKPERIQAELAKCQLLCRPCHIEKSAGEKRRPITHGTRSGYRRGCRCHACTSGHNEKRRKALGRTGKRLPCRCQECTAKASAGRGGR